jgi:hypothetical protein
MFTVVISTPSLTLVSTWQTWQEVIATIQPHIGFARRIVVKQDDSYVAIIKSFSSSIRGQS